LRKALLAVLVIVNLAVSLAAEERKVEKALTNADVIELANAKLGDDIVVAKIQQAPKEELDVSTDSLLALKKAGVGNAVVDAMIKRVSARGSKGDPAQAKATGNATNQNADQRPKAKPCGTEPTCPCVQSFTMEGSFIRGRTYKTSVPLGKLDRDPVYDRVAQFIATDGWRLATSSRDTGIITATQDVHWSDGKTAPLSAVMKEADDGLTIQLAFSTPAGTSAPKDAIIKDFCNITDAAAGN
jgi:hypothetical protein